MAKWSAEDVPELRGRSAVVTGGNGGLGLETASVLAARGARVLIACRNPKKGGAALERIRAESPEAQVETRELDLASLASVEACAEKLVGELNGLDLLVNNAGIMAIPRQQTADGFEMQLGTNHLGHFALTGRLLPLLLATEGSRVVNLSSTAHKSGRMDWDDLQGEQRYGPWRRYGQSKLANLLFTYELDRRLRARAAKTLAVAAHPGYAVTDLQSESWRQTGSSLKESVLRIGNRLLAQTAAMGALPTLYAATAPDVAGGDYFGPDGIMEVTGHPKKVGSSRRSQRRDDAARLWEVSEELTGVRYAALQ